LAIAPVIEDALSNIERAIRPPAAFDPKGWEGEFRIGMCDNLESAFFGPLAARLRQLSPGSRLIGVASERRDVSRMLDDGAFDFSVAVHGEPPSWHVRAPLFTQSFVCIYDPAQIKLKAPLGLDPYADAPHVAVSFEGNSSTSIDVALAGHGKTRNVVATVPRFSALPTALRAMPAIATIPESIARCMAQLNNLAIDLPAESVSMLYRRVDHADSRASWFRASSWKSPARRSKRPAARWEFCRLRSPARRSKQYRAGISGPPPAARWEFAAASRRAGSCGLSPEYPFEPVYGAKVNAALH
jgi:LysR family transcriptional activator of mexEF-oprN operon